MAAWPRLSIGREDVQLPLSGDLDGHALVQRLGVVDTRVERLGLSRAGRPIDLISVGHGSRAALIVGAPHANEPIGCATIERLLTRLARDRKLRNDSGWQWHFIPAIDIDGIALNEPWFRGERTLKRYFDSFYRPSFRLQPEYTFPLAVPGYRFDRETPESRSWRSALEHLRPQLQCSLHGADTGGSFFIVSDFRSRLCTQLASLPKAFDITLNSIGDSSAELTEFTPGIFSFPNIASTIEKALASRKRPQAIWNAGDSSAGYSVKRFGTFNMACEVPLWRDTRERDPRPSGQTLAGVLDDEIQIVRADEKLLKPFLDTLAARASSDMERELFASVEEAVLQTDGVVGELEEMKAIPAAQRVLANRELVQYEGGTAMFRTLAMAERLGRLTGANEIRALASDQLAERLSDFQRSARLTPVPLSSSTGLQMAAILATTRDLAMRGV
jgi:hypothetical protein